MGGLQTIRFQYKVYHLLTTIYYRLRYNRIQVSLITSTSLIDFADFNVASKLSNRFQIISANLLNGIPADHPSIILSIALKFEHHSSIFLKKKKRKNPNDKPYFIHFLLPPLTLVLAYFQDRTIARIFFPKRFRTLSLSLPLYMPM